MDAIHGLLDGNTVCDRHPGAKIVVYGNTRVCMGIFQESVKPADPPSVADEKPKKEEEPVFKTPQQLLAEKEEKLRRERSYYVKSYEDAIALGIRKMVTDGKTECTLGLSATRLTRDEYAEIAKKLRASGYLVAFFDKKTGGSILDNQPPTFAPSGAVGPRCQCGCSSEVSGVIQELAHIRDAVSAWASSCLSSPEKTHDRKKDEIAIEAHISIAHSGAEQPQQASAGEEKVPLFSVPQPQPHHCTPIPEEGRGPVMQLLMTTPITHILLAFFILPIFLPRFLVGIWQLFMGFILVSRFLRWNSRPIPVRRGHTNERCSSAQTGYGFVPGAYAAQGC